MERPTSIVVLGVLNILFAILGFLATLGSLFVLLGMNTTNPVYGIMQRSAAYRVFMFVSVPMGFLFIGVLGVAGVGLLISKAWGRKATIVYAIYALVMGVVGGVVNGVFLLPPLLEQASGGSPESIGAVGGAIGGMLGSFIGLIYPVVQIVFMYRKNVKEFFAQV